VDSRRRWGLALGPPYAAGAGGYAAPAQLPDGTPAVLKLIQPHREAEHEADALALWDGDGAVRLLDRSEDGWALLLERCEPGTPLSAAGPEAALDVLAGLLPRLWAPAGEPFRTLADEAAWWVSSLPGEWEQAGRPFERRLLDAALDALATLAPSQGEQVLLHQDLHGDNVLAAGREPWLAIDPKGLAGDPCFDVCQFLRNPEPVPLSVNRARLDVFCAELGLDRARVRDWCFVHAILDACWGFEDGESWQETVAYAEETLRF
jgi:streptomycin 6-kinase